MKIGGLYLAAFIINVVYIPLSIVLFQPLLPILNDLNLLLTDPGMFILFVSVVFVLPLPIAALIHILHEYLAEEK